MIGQGRPSTPIPPAKWKLRAKRRPWRSGLIVRALILAIATLGASRAMAADPDGLRLRIDWGGGAAHQWQGTVRLDQGTFSEVVPLGSAADQAGNYVAIGGTLIIRQRSARQHDVLDVTAIAPLDAKVTIEMHAAGEKAPPAPLALRLSDLIAGKSQLPLDETGNRIVLERAPGDSLRVQFERSSLVFEPEEMFDVRIVPHALGLEAGATMKLRVSIEEARSGREVWNQEFDLKATGNVYEPANIPLSLKLPAEEGVYDIRIAARRWGLRQRLDPTRRIAAGALVAERLVQCVVVGKAQPGPDAAHETPFKSVVELDPANPRWWQRFVQMPQLSRLPGLPKGPWDSGNLVRGQHPALNAVVQLPPQAWQALPLPIERIGAPHILEVDYPSDVAQTLAISLVEPNAAGEVVPLGLDSGIVRDQPSAGTAAKWHTHRLIFWPRTHTPIVLLVNRDDVRAAVHGKVRVLAGPARLPAKEPLVEGRSRRMLAGYFDRPLFPENFCASEGKDAATGRSFDDWVTFYEGATRLAEYLRHVGYGGVMLSVYAEGSAIYPSMLFDSSSQYDSGGMFATGQDPMRKDVLELLMRVFDREGLVVVPALHFSSPLPELETALAQGGPRTLGLELTGHDGRPWIERFRSPAGAAPYYNPLHPMAQTAMNRVTRELINRYAHHPSFGGLGLALDSDGFAALPSAASGLDDWTTGAFGQERRLKLDGDLAKRADVLLGPQREAWLRWRAARLAEFYERLAADVAHAQPDLKLYLASAGLFSLGSESRRHLQPRLTSESSTELAYLEAGMDLGRLARGNGTNVAWLRPGRIAAGVDPESLAGDLQLRNSDELDRHATAAQAGAQYLHIPEPFRLPAFDQISPFGKTKTFTRPAPHFTPSDEEQRMRFVEALAAHDAPLIFDGGWMMPLGQEAAMADWIEAYRRLPRARFETLAGVDPPLVVRWAVEGDVTYAYLVNNSPWPLEATLRVEAPANCDVQSLTPRRDVGLLVHGAMQTTWNVRLEPYDLVAASFSAPRVRFSEPQVTLPPHATVELTRRVHDLGTRLRQLADPPAWNMLANPGFEQPAKAGQIPGWLMTRQNGVMVEVTAQGAAVGRQSASITSQGPVASLVSEWFPAPRTGRLAVLLALRTDNAAVQPPFRVGIETQKAGSSDPSRRGYQWFPIGAPPAVVPLTNAWGKFIVPFEEVGSTTGTEVRVRFDLMAAGRVHLDEVQLFHLRFSAAEQLALTRIVTLAGAQLRGDRLADCARLLDGYWPRFLFHHVPPGGALAARREAPPQQRPQPAPEKAESPGVFDRLKKLKPF